MPARSSFWPRSGGGQFFVKITCKRKKEEVLKDVEVDLFGSGFVGEITDDVFYSLQEIVPVIDKFFIAGKIRCIEPLFQFHFCFGLFSALSGLQKVAETASFVVTTHREQTADAGADAVNAAAAFLV